MKVNLELQNNLYDVTHPNGSNFYGEAIENMNLLEAVPDQNLSLRYKLTDVVGGSGGSGGGSTGTYTISLAPTQTTLDDQRTSVSVTPTITGFDGALSYSVTTSGDSNIGAYLDFSINATTGVLTITRTNAPSVLKNYNFTILEENTTQEATARISILPVGLTQ